MLVLRTVLATMGALLLLATSAHAETFRVTGTADVAGTCTGTTCDSVRQAIASAAASDGEDTILVPAGTYQLELGALVIASAVDLQGAGARTTTIAGVVAGGSRVLEVNAAAVKLSGVTLSGGTALGDNGPHGGTLQNEAGTVTLNRVRVTGGSGLSGGGIANRHGTMLIENSLIDHNFATNGGGDGGGIINFGGDGLGPANLTVRNSTIAFNTARLAGGLISYGSPSDAVTLQNATIARNTATDRGIGGVAVDSGTGGTYTIARSIVADNVGAGLPSNCSGKIMPLGFNVESGTECAFEVHGASGLPDQLADRGGDTDVLAPTANSAAIGIVTTGCPSTDQRGVTRSAPCDAGAVEAFGIDSGPRGATREAQPTFTFSSDVGSGFVCKLDGPGATQGTYAACTSPYTPTVALRDGDYVFNVRVTVDGDPIGEPATRAFTVDSTPPSVKIDAGPSGTVGATTAHFEFSSDDPVATFECSLDSAAAAACTSPRDLVDLADGEHHFDVVAIDAAGNRSGPAGQTWTVDTTKPNPPVITAPANGTVVGPAGVTASGTSEALSSVELFDGTASLGRATIRNEGSGDWDLELMTLAEGPHTITAVAIDRTGNRSSPSAPLTLTVDLTGPTTTIAGPALTNDTTPTYTFTAETGASFECHLDDAPVECPSGSFTPAQALADGSHTLEATATDAVGNTGDPATKTFTVDTVAPPAASLDGTIGASGADFTFAAADADAFECRLDTAAFAPCSSPFTLRDLGPGEHRVDIVALDAAGNRSVAATRAFTIAAPPTATPQPQPQTAPPPPATPAAPPQPEAGEDVVVRKISGKVLVKRPGSNTFVELDATAGVPLGSTVDVKNGRIRLTFEPAPGRPVQRAIFYAGIFVVTQVGTTLDVKLSEPLASCPKRARAAAAKPKTRRLWGSGKGNFRTSGRLSSATVRGTTWLVEDSCQGTLTRVTEGLVAVRDFQRKKTILVRAGRSYLAKRK